MTECNILVNIPDGEFCDEDSISCKLFDSEYEFCCLFPADTLDYSHTIYRTIKHKKCPLLIKEANSDYTI